eukprot:g3594.t1
MSRSAAMHASARREAEERELQREYAQLKMEHASLQRRKEELETKNQNMREEIVALDEQLDRKTGNLFSKLQQIKNNDALKKKLQESLKKRSMDNVDDLDDLIHHARAVSKNAARKAPDSIDGAILQDLASIASLIKRLEKHVNISSVDVVDGGSWRLADKGGSENVNRDIERVLIIYGSKSCSFKVSESHSFERLLKEAVKYWSLDYKKHILADESNCVYPQGAPVTEVLRQSLATLSREEGEPRILLLDITLERVKGREMQEEMFESSSTSYGSGSVGGSDIAGREDYVRNDIDDYVNEEEEEEDDDEEEEESKYDVNAPTSNDAQTIWGAPTDLERKPEGSISTDNGGAGAKIVHTEDKIKDYTPGMDLAFPAEMQTEHSSTILKPISAHALDCWRYADLFLFLSLIVLYGNSLFLRHDVPTTSSVYSLVKEDLYGPFASENSGTNSTVLYSFDDISTLSDFWRWFDGPLRASVTGMAQSNGTGTNNGASAIPPRVGRFNIIVGRPRIMQWRVNQQKCFRKYGLSEVCSGNFASEENQARGLQPGMQVYVGDAGMSTKATIERRIGKAYHPKFKVSGTSEELERWKISTSSWTNVEALDSSARQALYGNTSAFIFDDASQSDYEQLGFTSLVVNRWVTGSSFNGGGFSAVLPRDGSEYDSEASLLRKYGWIDGNTRAVEVGIHLYNPNLDYIIVTKAMVEFSPSGAVKPAYLIRVFRLNEFWRKDDILRLGIEIAALVIVCLHFMALICRSIGEAVRTLDDVTDAAYDIYDATAQRAARRRDEQGLERRLGCISSARFRGKRCISIYLFPWHVVDCAITGLSVLDLWLRTSYMRQLSRISSSTLFSSDTYTSALDEVARQQKVTVVIDAFLLLILVLKAFKYLSLNSNISVISRVLSRSGRTLVNYMLVCIIFLFAFAVTGHILFGPQDEDFMTIMGAYNAMLQIFTGRFDFEKLRRANGFMAPVYFFSVAIIGFYALRNLFTALVTAEYAKIGAEIREKGYYWIRSPEEVAAEKRRDYLAEQVKWRHPMDVKRATINSSNRVR